ncbi:MAG: DUF58 domain-containing protein [Phycisphaerales bacterium]|nr:DUF58 domain-containing protein [Phycisphaerales bacterium]
MITEELMQAVKRLEIRARRRVDDMFGGSYHSAFKGQGIEFSEVREYQPGDDVRSIDWNVTARMGRPFIKRFEEERQLTVVLAVDCSRSTSFGTIRRSKHELMSEVGAVLTLAAGRNNDKVGLCLFGSEHLEDGKTLHVPATKGRLHGMRIIRELIDATPGDNQEDLASVLTEIGRTHKRRSIIIVLSDFLSGLNNEQEPNWGPKMRMLSRKHEVIAMQFTDPRELELPKAGIIRMHDPITGTRHLVDTNSKRVRERYRRQSQIENTLILDTLQKAHIDHIELSTGRDYADELVRYFQTRGSRR